VLKRGVDILLSLVGLIVFLPILALAAILIKLDSQGPILFSQPRMGRGFTRFRIWKLRTMRSGPGLIYTMGQDPRITRVGRWLRRLKIDELPQLFNVLCGDMSLVGPRPVVPELAIEFRHAYRRLLVVRPGLTDPASIKYCREGELMARMSDQSRYFKTVLVPDKIRLSTAYMAKANVLTDVAILFQTFWALTSFTPAPSSLLDSQPGRDLELLRRPMPRLRFTELPPAHKKPPVSQTANLPGATELEQA